MWADHMEVYEKELTLRMQERQELLKDTQLEVAAMLEHLQDWAADAARCHDAQSLGWALASLDVAGGDAERCVAEGVGDGSLLHVCARSASLAASRGGRGLLAARATARALVGWGAHPDQVDASGETPLQLALRRSPGGHAAKEPAKALLEVNADPDQPARPGTDESLLMEAAREGDLATCELLLEHRADPLKRREDGQTAITLAARPGASRQVLLTLRSALTRDLAYESGEEPGTNTQNGFAAPGVAAVPRRLAPGPFSKMAQAATVAPDEKAPPPRRRTSFGAFSKMAKPSVDETPLDRQVGEDLVTPSSDQVQSMSFAESESETRLGDETDEGPSRATLFSMSDIGCDGEEMCSAEGILNQVDIEEAYDDDWTVRHLSGDWPAHEAPSFRGAAGIEAHNEGYSANSWGVGLPEGSALEVVG